MDLPNEEVQDDEVEYALQPARSFTAQLKEEVQAYERMRRGELGSLHDLKDMGRWLAGARIAGPDPGGVGQAPGRLGLPGGSVRSRP